MARGLFDPLGTDREVKPRPTMISAPLLTSGIVLVALTALLIASVLRDDGNRGEPSAVSVIQHVTAPASPPKPAAKAAAVVEPPSLATSSALPPVRDDQEVEIQNGVRIIRPRRSGGLTGGQILKVPNNGEPSAAPQARPAGSGPSSTP